MCRIREKVSVPDMLMMLKDSLRLVVHPLHDLSCTLYVFSGKLTDTLI